MNKIMKSTLFFQLLLLALWIVIPQTLQAADDSAGTEFYLAFQPNEYRWATDRSLTLFITGKEDTQGTVTIPGLNLTQTFAVQANQITSVTIPIGAQNLGENTVTRLGVHITAQSEVTVTGLNRFEGSADSFLALPVDILGLEYLAMSYPGIDSSDPSQVAVVGAFDNTRVTITPAGAANGHPAGIPFTVVLNRGDAYQIRGSGAADLTGTRISATAPVAVMSGDNSTFVPVDVLGADHLVEMMPPVASWGRSFLTVPFATRLKGDTFRILASQDGTVVRINGTIAATLNRGKFLESVWDASALIEASAPILVAQYSNGWDYDENRVDLDVDPSMMLIVPTEQFLSQYTFNSPAHGYATHYINVTAPTSAIATLLLDGLPLSASYFSAIGNSGFSGAQVPISAGSHTISGNVQFGVYVYGYASGWGESYAHPAGMAVKFINPSGDSFAPNLKLTQVGDIISGIATDSEDVNANGLLDSGEDLNANGIIDPRSEDVNGNGVLDPGEDLNGNGILDKDTGIFKVELEAGATNLKLDVSLFVPGALTVYFTFSLLDPALPGSGVLRVSDGVGNVTQSQISLSGSVPTLNNVRLIDTISINNIDLDSSSFSKTPYSVTTTGDRTVIEWRFDTFPADAVQDLGFELVLKNPAAGEQRLVSHKLELTYTDINGNEVRNELDPQYVRVLNSAFDNTITADKSVYQANENISLNVRLTNLSEFSRTIDATITIEDGQGNTVQSLTALSALQFAAGEVKNFGNTSFNTGSYYAGGYRAHLVLTENQKQIGESFAGFTIQPTLAISSQVTTDKLSYNPNEGVAITSTVSSVSTNYTFANLTANMSIASSVGGTQLYSESKPITALMPGAMVSMKSYWNTGTYSPGTYPVTLEIKDATGTVLSTAASNITIASTQQPSKLLTGQIAVDKQSILSGEPVRVTYSVTNKGNIDLSDIALKVQTVHVVEQTVYGTITDQTSLVKGGSYNSSGQIDTGNFSAKDYLVVLRASINGIEETLAGTFFRVEGAPSAPSLSLPGNGSDVETFTPVLIVNNASDPNDDQLTYEFEVYSDAGLTSLIASSGSIPETTGVTAWTVPLPLTENQTYFWRSRAYDGKLFGPWMNPATFRVNTSNDSPTAPTVSSPADNTAVAVLTPVLIVNNASDPDSPSLTYNFDAALDPGFTQIVASIKGVLSGQGATSWQVPVNLNENTTYYWRAQADDWLIEGPWSTTAAFFVNTANDSPTVPSIIAPTNNAEVTTLSPDIVLSNSTDPDSSVLTYFLEVDIVQTFDSPGIIRSGSIPQGQATTTWQATGLHDNTQYYVRVKASDGIADSGWSNVSAFFVNTVNDPPTTPILANPSNGAGVNVFTPTLSVYNSSDPDRDVLTYEFELYGDAAMTNRIASSAEVVETSQITSWTVSVSLTENQTYYWRARAFDGEAYSNWMLLASFMVNTANDAPGAPQLYSPSEGSSVATLTPTLSVMNAVDPDSDSLTYEFEVYNGDVLVQTMTKILQDSSGVTSTALSTPLSDNTTYRWRTRAYDGDRYGAWMTMASFIVHLPQTTITVDIDFDPETLHKGSHGKWVKVTIELPHGYKASDVDISSIRLEGTVPAEPWPYEIKGHHHDHGCDRDHAQHDHSELTVKFRRSDVIAVLPSGEHVPVHITGKVGTTTFEGIDIIRVIK